MANVRVGDRVRLKEGNNLTSSTAPNGFIRSGEEGTIVGISMENNLYPLDVQWDCDPNAANGPFPCELKELQYRKSR